MANRFGGAEGIKEAMQKYGSGLVPFFSDLKEDESKATVRFLYTDPDSLDIELVHEVEDGGSKKKVRCMEAGCPLCQLGKPRIVGFLFLWNYKNGQVEVWERGRAVINDLMGFNEMYGELNNRDYTIIRHGKKGDNKTTYQMFPMDKGPMLDPKTKEPMKFKNLETGAILDLPIKPDMYETVVRVWTAEQMSDYLAESQSREKNNRGSGSRPRF